MGLPKRLTEMQMKFAQSTSNKRRQKDSDTECAIEAGYDKDTARMYEHQNYRNPKTISTW